MKRRASAGAEQGRRAERSANDGHKGERGVRGTRHEECMLLAVPTRLRAPQGSSRQRWRERPCDTSGDWLKGSGPLALDAASPALDEPSPRWMQRRPPWMSRARLGCSVSRLG